MDKICEKCNHPMYRHDLYGCWSNDTEDGEVCSCKEWRVPAIVVGVQVNDEPEDSGNIILTPVHPKGKQNG